MHKNAKENHSGFTGTQKDPVQKLSLSFEHLMTLIRKDNLDEDNIIDYEITESGRIDIIYRNIAGSHIIYSINPNGKIYSADDSSGKVIRLYEILFNRSL